MKRTLLVVFLLLAAAVAWLALIEPVKADGCRRVYYPTTYNYSYPTYSAAYTDYKEVVKVREVVVPTYAVVPLFGAYHVPPVQQAAAAAPAPAAAPAMPNPAAAPMPQKAPCADVDARVKQLETRFDQLIQALNASAGKPPAPAKPPSTPPGAAAAPAAGQAVTVLKTRCAACHTGEAKDGDGFKMFEQDGTLSNLSDKQWGKVGSKLATQKMPPKKDAAGKDVPQVTDGEYAVIAEFLDSRK